MKISLVFKLVLILCTLLSVSGCVIKNGAICGPQTPLANCDPEVNRELMHPTPLSDYWNKGNATSERGRQDWVGCGGSANGGYNLTESEFSSGNLREASSRKFDELQYCMMRKGYRYTGTCEGEIPSKYPACKNPRKYK